MRCEGCNLERCQCKAHHLTFDTDYIDRRTVRTINNDAVCPHCGSHIGNLWERDDEASHECECGAVITIHREVTVEYVLVLERVETDEELSPTIDFSASNTAQ